MLFILFNLSLLVKRMSMGHFFDYSKTQTVKGIRDDHYKNDQEYFSAEQEHYHPKLIVVDI